VVTGYIDEALKDTLHDIPPKKPLPITLFALAASQALLPIATD
jgi:hypothetical protein